jgi:hypothetical protein
MRAAAAQPRVRAAAVGAARRAAAQAGRVQRQRRITLTQPATPFPRTRPSRSQKFKIFGKDDLSDMRKHFPSDGSFPAPDGGAVKEEL